MQRNRSCAVLGRAPAEKHGVLFSCDLSQCPGLTGIESTINRLLVPWCVRIREQNCPSPLGIGTATETRSDLDGFGCSLCFQFQLPWPPCAVMSEGERTRRHALCLGCNKRLETPREKRNGRHNRKTCRAPAVGAGAAVDSEKDDHNNGYSEGSTIEHRTRGQLMIALATPGIEHSAPPAAGYSTNNAIFFCCLLMNAACCRQPFAHQPPVGKPRHWSCRIWCLRLRNPREPKPQLLPGLSSAIQRIRWRRNATCGSG